MRQKTYSDKQREAQQQKKQDELWEKTHPKADTDKPEEAEEKTEKTEQPERRTA